MGRFTRSLILAGIALAVAGLGAAFGVWSWSLAIALAFLAIAVIALAHRHIADLEALRRALDDLLRGRVPASARRPMLAPVADAADRVAALGRHWREREDALEAAKAIDQAVFEAIPDPLVLVDRSRRVIRANAAMRDLFGLAIVDSRVDTVLRNPAVLDMIDEALVGRPAPSVSLNIPGGPERTFNVRLASFGGGNAGPFVLLMLYDATAIRHAERMRADFVANVSHELRTPLSALLGFIETLRGPARDDTEARDHFLKIMHEQASRMTRLVSDLLSLSKIEESEHNPPVQSVALAPILGSVADALSFQARAKGMTIMLDLAPDLPTIAGDADQLVQVFQNLIDNAIKYGRAQTAVRISAKKSQGAVGNTASGQVIAVIADEGDGIAREHLPRLTERFYRVDAGRSRQLGGTGLGLAIVKHIVNRHRGALTIESEQGRGTTVTVYLPIGAKS